MVAGLAETIDTLRKHQAELRGFGLLHASVFGSVARRQARSDSDVDVLIELDPNRPIRVFEYARLKLRINDLLGGSGDVVNRRNLKPLLRDNVLREAVNVF
jgi:uncharacterized protein